MNILDRFLNQITMYRLVLYYLILLDGVAIIFSFFGILPYNPLALILSTAVLIAVSYITNRIFSWGFEAPTNVESVYISSLILALIITPTVSLHVLPIFFWASVWAMASKYIFAVSKKHIFNPVAIAMVLTTFGIGLSASWWVGGNLPMFAFVLLGGLLIVKKVQRFDMVFSFLIAAVISCVGLSVLNGADPFSTLQKTFLHTPILFFAFIMLTEPLTTPPTKTLQVIYGALVGFLFAPQIHLGSIYSTPELALFAGNIFSFAVSPKLKLLLHVKEKLQIAPDIYDFVFIPSKKISFTPGQYMEWTLPHPFSDSRGNRRYFTIASSPTEGNIRLGVRFPEKGSSYKHALAQMNEKVPIVGAQIAGDFTLPTDPKQKLVFIAGGIGITPFRSMIKYLTDIMEKRDIVLLYAAKTPLDFVYTDIFSAAEKVAVRTIYTATDETSVPSNWKGKVGRIDMHMVTEEIPDFKERVFYLSGPKSLIDAYEQVLKDTGINPEHIKKDFFPGFV